MNLCIPIPYFKHTSDISSPCATVEIEEVGQEKGHDGQGSKAGQQRVPGRALQLELVHKPQDSSADAAVSLALSSSYIVYSAAALEGLQAFFHTEEVNAAA